MFLNDTHMIEPLEILRELLTGDSLIEEGKSGSSCLVAIRVMILANVQLAWWISGVQGVVKPDCGCSWLIFKRQDECYFSIFILQTDDHMY